MIKASVKVTDKDMGFKRLAAELGQMGTITLGVQGKEAEQAHPSARGLTVGHVAAIHHLGAGVPARPWLTDWVDANVARTMTQTQAALREVLEGRLSRNQALQKLGYGWTKELRDRVWEGGIRPALAATTISRKGGETRPLLDTGTLMNSITYKVFLPAFKSIRDTVQRAAARRGAK